MGGDGSPAPMSRRQFTAVVHRIAWTYLEVERGLRPGNHLAKFLTRDEYLRHRTVTRTPVPGGWGPVRPTDIGSIRLRGVDPERVEAVVMARRGENGWGALIVDLERGDTGWQVRTLGRLEQLPQQQMHRAVDPPEPSDLLRRRWLVQRERRDAAAARDAVAARIEEIGDRRTTPARALQPHLTFWTDHVSMLDVELTTLRRHERAQQLRAASRTTLPLATKEVRPEAEVAPGLDATGWSAVTEQRWQLIEGEIRAYRDQWNVDDDEPIIGTQVGNELQAADRRRLVNRLLTSARQPDGLWNEGRVASLHGNELAHE